MLHNAIVQKESLSAVRFADHDVLTTADERLKREENLYRAMLLGNAFHQKVKIIFSTLDDDVLNVETTVWYTSDNFVLLKGARTIPVRCILEVII